MSRFLTLLVGLLFVILQSTLVNLIAIQSIKPDIIVIFLVGRSLMEGPTAGVLWGFGLGFLLDALSGGVMGLASLAYSITGFLSGYLGSGKVITRVYYLGVLALGVIVVHIIFLYFGEPWQTVGFLQTFLRRTLPAILYSWCLGLLWMISPFSRFGSEKKRG
jgi:rod shape-determining protein MreD